MSNLFTKSLILENDLVGLSPETIHKIGRQQRNRRNLDQLKRPDKSHNWEIERYAPETLVAWSLSEAIKKNWSLIWEDAKVLLEEKHGQGISDRHEIRR